MSVKVYSNDDSLDWMAKGEDRIIQNVRNILRTRISEIPFVREMGIDPDLIDSDSNSFQEEFISHVKEVINTYEPRVEIISVKIETVEANGNYIIAVELEV